MYAYNANNTINTTKITHKAKLMVELQGHRSTEWYFITDNGSKSMVIGMTWLRSHNPVINWRTGQMEFTRCPFTCQQHRVPKEHLGFLMDHASITTKYPVSEVISLICQEINAKTNPSTAFAIEDLKTWTVLTMEDIHAGPFADFADMFKEANYQELPPHCQWDHKIDLIPEWEQHKWKPRIYLLTYNEKKELDAFLEENLNNWCIQPSESPLAFPVSFIIKKDGKKFMVIDYRKLNDLTVKNVTLGEFWASCNSVSEGSPGTLTCQALIGEVKSLLSCWAKFECLNNMVKCGNRNLLSR
jgi:hypothetical protein